jgi:hypothetical protein
MKTTTISPFIGGLIGILFLLSCSSDNSPQSQPKTSTVPIVVPEPRLIIDSPESGSVGLTVIFRWHIQEAKEGETYRYKVRLDKGQNACDNGIEEELDAGTKTCLRVDLPYDRYNNASVDFAVQGADSQGHRFCVQGRRFVVDPHTPASLSCDSNGDKKEAEANKNARGESK